MKGRSPEKVFPIPDSLSPTRAYWWLMSHMLHPESKSLALGEFTAELVANEFKNQAPSFIVDIPLGWLRALLVSPSFEERENIHKRAWKDGMTAGTILSLVYAMHRAGIPEPSVNKAMEVLDSGEFGDTVHRGTKEIRKAMKRMAPFAHLWAANAMLCYTDSPPSVAPGSDGLELFLRWAVTIREFGISHTTVHGSKSPPLVDPSICVALPPRFTPTADISLPLSRWIIDILNAYRAPKKM